MRATHMDGLWDLQGRMIGVHTGFEVLWGCFLGMVMVFAFPKTGRDGEALSVHHGSYKDATASSDLAMISIFTEFNGLNEIIRHFTMVVQQGVRFGYNLQRHSYQDCMANACISTK